MYGFFVPRFVVPRPGGRRHGVKFRGCVRWIDVWKTSSGGRRRRERGVVMKGSGSETTAKRVLLEGKIKYGKLRGVLVAAVGVCALMCFVSVATRRYVGFGFFAIVANVIVYLYVDSVKRYTLKAGGKTVVSDDVGFSSAATTASDFEEWHDPEEKVMESLTEGVGVDRQELYSSFREEWDDEIIPPDIKTTLTTDEFDKQSTPVERVDMIPRTLTNQGSTYSISFERSGMTKEEQPKLSEEADLVGRTASPDGEEELLTYEVRSTQVDQNDRYQKQKTSRRRRKADRTPKPLTLTRFVRMSVRGVSHIYQDIIMPLGVIASLIWQDVETLYAGEEVDEPLVLGEVVLDDDQSSWAEWDRSGRKDPVSVFMDSVNIDEVQGVVEEVKRGFDTGVSVASDQFQTAKDFVVEMFRETNGKGQQGEENGKK